MDWVTPFSLLYLYKHISTSHLLQEKLIVKNSNDLSVGTEGINILLEHDEDFYRRQPKTLSVTYTEVMVLTDYVHSSAIMTKPQYFKGSSV